MHSIHLPQLQKILKREPMYKSFCFQSKTLHFTFVLLGRNSETNPIRKKIQEPGIGLDMYVTHVDATKNFFNRNRERLMSESVYQSKTK